MAKTDYLPSRDAEFVLWHDNFKAQASTIGGTLGITAADLTALNNDNTSLHEVMEAAADLEARASQATAEKNMKRKEVEQRVRTFAKRLKLHAAYNSGFGEQLKIEGPEEIVDLTDAQPKIKATPEPHGLIVLTFVKSKSDGVSIYSHREGESSFTFLARDTNSPYIDNRPCLVPGKMETRAYKARYIVDDQEVGRFSDEVTVICQP